MTEIKTIEEVLSDMLSLFKEVIIANGEKIVTNCIKNLSS